MPPIIKHELLRRVVPEYSELFDARLLTDYERVTIEQRLEAARRQVRQVFEAGKQLKLPAHGGPPPSRADGRDLDQAFRAFLEQVLDRDREGLKPSVLKEVLDGATRTYLWSNLSSLPVFHELSVLAPWWAGNRMQSAPLRRLADYLVREMLHGVVLSLQHVRKEVLTADEVYLAHCACRSSGIAHDLRQGDSEKVFTIVSESEGRRLLDRLIDRFEELGDDRLGQTTDPRYRSLLRRLAASRRKGSDDYRLETLLEETWHEWEILPVKRGFTTAWVRSMANNGKCAPLDHELAFELVHIFFHGRGALFNSMKCVNSPYTICTCPTPENEGGCILTNWYYFGQLNSSLVPADDHHGRRRDLRGELLPCRYFPVRARRDCIGCGCNHSIRGPRDLDASLAEADEVLARFRRGELG
jgi:hypothetical protein